MNILSSQKIQISHLIWRSVEVLVSPWTRTFPPDETSLPLLDEMLLNPSQRSIEMWQSLLSLQLSSNLMHTVAFSRSEMHILKVSCWPKAASQRGTSEDWEGDSNRLPICKASEGKSRTLHRPAWVTERKEGARKEKHLRRKKKSRHNIDFYSFQWIH